MNKRLRRYCRAGSLVALIAAVTPVITGCKPKSGGAAVVGGTQTGALPTKAAPTKGQEVADVKAMLGELKNMKSIDQMPEFFTNESAAAFGVIMMIPLAMVAAFEDMGGQMAAEFGKLGGNQTAQPPKPSGMPKVKAELETTLKKYGLSDKTQPDKQAVAALSARGREFFRDMVLLLQKMDKAGKNKSGFDMSPEKAPDPEDATYEVVSPTRVKVTLKKPGDKMMENMEARFEDGRWRIHFGGIEELMSKAGGAFGGMGGGMGMPGAGPMGGQPGAGAGP